ncbi:hypothetical protein [Nocardioides speluncae]|uniref:hypothetical protein n=1 Tax=Nocardioides speluncae TaxID=2670337 RepID=UPI000D68E03D|nr:hypothetical protein [Nocardioides speluncae]
MASDLVTPARAGAPLAAGLATLLVFVANMVVSVRSWRFEAGADGMQRSEIVSWFLTIGAGLSLTAFVGLLLLLPWPARRVGVGVLAGLALTVLGNLVWVYVDVFRTMS